MHLKLSRKVGKTSAVNELVRVLQTTEMRNPYLQPVGLFTWWYILLLLQSKNCWEGGFMEIEPPRTRSAASRNTPFGAVRNSSFASSPNIPNGDWNLAGNRGMVNIPEWIERCQVTEQTWLSPPRRLRRTKRWIAACFVRIESVTIPGIYLIQCLILKPHYGSSTNRYISRLPDRHVNGSDTHPLAPNGVIHEGEYTHASRSTTGRLLQHGPPHGATEDLQS